MGKVFELTIYLLVAIGLWVMTLAYAANDDGGSAIFFSILAGIVTACAIVHAWNELRD